MNLSLIKKELFSLNQLFPIGKTVCTNSGFFHVVGFALRGSQLHLYVLQYDEKYAELLEADEEKAASEISGLETKITNRTRLTKAVTGPSFAFDVVKAVEISGTRFRLESQQCRLLGPDYLETALFSAFLLRGWDPKGAEECCLERMYLTDMLFADAFDRIPLLSKGEPMRFLMDDKQRCETVEMPIKLRTGETSCDKIFYCDKNSGKKHWLFIDGVRLCDVWDDIAKMFQRPEMTSKFAPDMLVRCKVDAEEAIEKLCQRGMRLPVIEYECSPGESLEFFDRCWLDEESADENNVSGLLMMNEKNAGKCGQPIKTSVIQHQVSPDTKEIDAELLFCHIKEKVDDIEIIL